MKRFEAVIFDMDGLLLDTERIALACFHETCEQFGMGDETELFMRCVGTNAALGEQVLKEGLQGRADHLAFVHAWDAKYIERTSNTAIPLKDGAADLLADLAATKLLLGVATSTATSRAMQKLDEAGILSNFSVIIGGDQAENGKPHADIYLKAAEALGVVPKNCLALEDSENGVRAASGAGMTVIQIPDLVQPSLEFLKHGQIVFASLHDVRAFLAG